jgi:WD40 repeat protein/serine/threonine protein kinase
MTNLLALPSETVLAGKYRVRRVLGAGGFGITYLAHQIALDRQVTIKEYFPADYAARIDDVQAVPRSRDCASDYKWGLDRFIAEAQTLAKFEHPHIVRVFDYFQANQTAYMVLQFEVGKSLRNWHKDLGRAPRQAELDKLVPPLLDALEMLHKSDFLHRDIAPDNIIVRDGLSPVLIDFGSARGEIAHQSRTVSALVKPGYSPYEQYATTTSQQGPWTDIYALGATLYQLVCGKRPPDAPARIVKDEYLSARDAAIGSYRPAFLAAIDKALRLEPKDRPQSIMEWRGPLLAPVEKAPARPRGGLTFGLRKPPVPEPEPEVRAASIAQASAMPPPPDAPQPQGQFLDYVERLKGTAAKDAGPLPGQNPGANIAPAAAVAGVANPPAAREAHHGLGYGPSPLTQVVPPAAAVAASPAAKVSPGLAPAAPVANLPARLERAVPDPAAPVPLRKVRGSRWRHVLFFLRPPWRGLLFKLGVGAGVATLAVTHQDLLPAAWKPVAQAPSAPAAPSLQPPRPVSTSAVAVPLPTVTRPAVELRPSVRFPSHRGPVLAVGFEQSGRRLVSVGSDAQVRVSEIETGAVVRTISLAALSPASTPVAAPAGALPSAASPGVFAPLIAAALQGSSLMTAHADGAVTAWDIERGERLAATRRLDGAVTAVSFTSEPERVAVAGADGKVMLLDRRAGGTPTIAGESHRDVVRAMVFVPERNGLLTGSADRTIKSWNGETLSLRRTFVGHRDAVTALDAAADGRAFVSGSDDGVIRLWSITASQARRTLRGHTARIAALAFGPDSDLLASAAADGTVKLWDLRRGREVGTLLAGSSAVRAITFTTDGRRMVTASEDGTVAAWDVAAVLSRRAD